MTLYDHITGWMYQQRDKHGLGGNYVEDTVNSMDNHELIAQISDFLEMAGVIVKDDKE